LTMSAAASSPEASLWSYTRIVDARVDGNKSCFDLIAQGYQRLLDGCQQK
jgi:hypothetical protein